MENMKMRQYDFAPFYKTTIGFDRLASLLDDMNGRKQNVPNYPPYNIERVDENNYRLTMAVAGFSDKDLFMEVDDNVLTVRGEKVQVKEDAEYLHQGIAARNFERQFSLEDYVEVEGASLENGLLFIHLYRELPEAKKPKKIIISASNSQSALINKNEGVAAKVEKHAIAAE
jgi:molecular chaperone IbpA